MGNFLLDPKQVPHLGGIPNFPGKRDLGEFIDFNKKNTHHLANIGHKLYDTKEWDLFFIYFLTLDRIKHFLWRYCDHADPTHPGKTEYDNIIKDFYLIYDKVIGDFLQHKKPGTNVLIISDHGHQRRCTKVFNINEFLRRNKWLSMTTSKGGWWKIIIEKLKVVVLITMDKYNCQDIVFKLVRLIPNREALKKSSYIIDKENSLCFASEFCSTNPAGGIELNEKLLKTRDISRHELVNEVIKELNQIVDSTTGEKVVEWVRTRESLFKGKNNHKYPPILFNLKEDYGVNWNLFTDLISVNVTHKKISGGHRKKGVFIFDEPLYQHPMDITKLYSFILKIFYENSPSK
jgi:predicted AlkP superfamily phosphohydrolase/phosphomutase